MRRRTNHTFDVGSSAAVQHRDRCTYTVYRYTRYTLLNSNEYIINSSLLLIRRAPTVVSAYVRFSSKQRVMFSFRRSYTRTRRLLLSRFLHANGPRTPSIITMMRVHFVIFRVPGPFIIHYLYSYLLCILLLFSRSNALKII